MRIFIAGGTSSIGKNLILLLHKKYKITASYRNKNKIFKKKNLKWCTLDKIKNKKISSDILINCIVTHENSKKNEIYEYINSNVLVIQELITLFKKNKFKLFLNLSTISVYEKNLSGVIHEKSKKNKNNILAITKIFGENLVKNSNINYLNLRLPSVIDFKKNNYNWINNIHLKFLKNKTIKLLNPNNKINSIVDTIEISKIVDFLLINKKFKLKKTVNFMPENKISIIKIVNLIKLNLNSNSKISYNYKPFKQKKYCTKNIKKIIKFNVSSIKEILERNLK